MKPAASHHNYLKAQETLKPYLEEIYSRTKENNLILNPDKSTATLFTPDPAEYNKTLNLRINNTLIPTVKNPKILGVTLAPKLNFAEHTRITKDKADKSLNVVKALTSTTWGKQKKTLIATYKTITRPVIEYGNTLWSQNHLRHISTNSTPKTLHSELSQAAPQTQTANIYSSTHRNTNTPTQYPPQTACITTKTKSSTSYSSSSSTPKQ